MRKSGRVVLLFVLSLLSTAVLGAVAALLATVSLAATALIVPGTGTPDANVVADYRQNFVDRYSAPFNPSCTSTNSCTLTGIDYPASFFPLVIFPGWCEPGRCETWNASVGAGVDGLVTAVEDLDDPDGALLLGYSQGGAVVSDALRELADNQALLDKVAGVVLIGNIYNPDGGLFTRLGFLPTIPFLDITFGPQTPVDLGVPITSIGFQYDPVMYSPLYFGNVLALVNAFAAFDNVHGFYLTPNGNGPTDSIAYGYTEEEIAEILAGPCPGPNCRLDSNLNEYWMIPAKSLPIMDLIMASVPGPLKPLVQPLVDLISPAAKVLIDLAYDFSGDPGQTRYLSILPFSPTTNFLQVGVDLVEAVVEGIENVLGGGSTMISPADASLLALSARSSESESVVEDDGQPADVGTDTDSVALTTDDATKADDSAADAEQTAREAAKAEREAAREAAKAEREAAKAEREAAREAAKAEREAAREAAKAEREAAKAEAESADSVTDQADQAAA